MAIEPKSADTQPISASTFENEIPTYRAVSKLAVGGLLCGLGSLFTFADSTFALFGLSAVVLGALAEMRIRRFPEMLTGRGMAQAGIALGLVFSLSALTYGMVAQVKIRRSAEQFARKFQGALESGRIEDAAFYRLPPSQRKGVTPKKQLDEMVKSAQDPAAIGQYLGPLQQIQNLGALPGGSIRLLEIEKLGNIGLTPYAVAIYEVHGTKADGKHADQYAAVELRSDPTRPGFNWWVKEVAFPYERKSYKVREKPIDDGHGHAH